MFTPRPAATPRVPLRCCCPVGPLRQAARIVIPLVTLPPNNAGDPDLMPEFHIEGRIVFLNPLRILTVPTTALGGKITSLADDASSTAVIRAINEVISRAYG
jgi:CcdB protein